jgi:hypothetical protein
MKWSSIHCFYERRDSSGYSPVSPVEARFRSQSSPYEICGGQSGNGRGFSLFLQVFLSVSFHQCSILVFVNTLLLPGEQAVESWQPSAMQYSHGNWGTSDRNVNSFRSLSCDMYTASTVRSSAFSFNFHYPILSVKSCSNWLLLPHSLPVTSIPPAVLLSMIYFKRQFLINMWSIKLAFLLFYWM